MKIKDEQFFKSIKEFLENYLIKQKGYSTNTQKSYKESLALLLLYFKEVKGLPHAKVGFNDLNYGNLSDFSEWLTTKRKCTASTVSIRLAAIKSFAKYCSIVDPSKIIIQVDVKNVSSPKGIPKIVDFISEKAMDVLVSQPNPATKIGLRDKAFILLMYDTAARCQEMLDIQLCDLFLRKAEPTVRLHGKGDKLRTTPISNEIVPILTQYLDVFHPIATRCQNTHLFYTTIHGRQNRMAPDTVALFIKKYSAIGHMQLFELPEHLRPHQIRHSRAMHLYRNGLPLVLLSEYLGHSDPRSTKVYAWSDTEMKRKAIAKTPRLEFASSSEQPQWQSDDAMILKLYGLA